MYQYGKIQTQGIGAGRSTEFDGILYMEWRWDEGIMGLRPVTSHKRYRSQQCMAKVATDRQKCNAFPSRAFRNARNAKAKSGSDPLISPRLPPRLSASIFISTSRNHSLTRI